MEKEKTKYFEARISKQGKHDNGKDKLLIIIPKEEIDFKHKNKVRVERL